MNNFYAIIYNVVVLYKHDRDEGSVSSTLLSYEHTREKTIIHYYIFSLVH